MNKYVEMYACVFCILPNACAGGRTFCCPHLCKTMSVVCMTSTAWSLTVRYRVEQLCCRVHLTAP